VDPVFSAPDILVVRFSAIGDILLTTPLLRALRTAHPGARITVLTKSRFAPLLSHNPHLNEVIGIEPGEGIGTVARRIRGIRYSHMLDLHGGLRSRLLRRLVPGPWSTYRKRRVARAALIVAKRDLYGDAPPMAERYFEAAESLGVWPDGGPPDFFLGEAADARAASLLAELGVAQEGRPLVAMAPGAAHATKRWPTESWTALARRVAATGADVALLGGPDDVAAAQWVAEHAGVSVASLAGVLGLQETGAVIRRAEVLVSGDTGLMHMATGVGTPVVALFGPTVGQFGFFPYNADRSAVVELELACRPCSAQGGRACPLGHHRCLRAIADEDVFDRLCEALA
jgi:lipopolysaccharide heptosyltransferase II